MSYDDCDPGKVKQAIENAEVQYRLKELYEVIVRAEIALVIAVALDTD